MKKFTAKAKRQQVKKAQKGHGIWSKRISHLARCDNSTGPRVLALRLKQAKEILAEHGEL